MGSRSLQNLTLTKPIQGMGLVEVVEGSKGLACYKIGSRFLHFGVQERNYKRNIGVINYPYILTTKKLRLRYFFVVNNKQKKNN